MNLIINAGIWVLNVIYSLMKLLPVQEKIVYISRQSDEIPVDFLMIKEYIQQNYPEYENVIMAKTLKDGLLAKIEYILYMFKMMYQIGTSRAVILDTYCIPVSILKQRRELVVVQIWHALGAFKKFGYSILDKGEGTKSGLAKVMRMHENYTYVLASSEYCRPYFAEAFHQNIDKVKAIPLPRVDILADDQWKQDSIQRVRKCYPQLKDKKVIVYAPTFRKGVNHLEDAMAALLDVVDYSKYEVVIKRHPLSDFEVKNGHVIMDEQFTTQEMLNVADYVITDYSATMYEAAFMGKPLFFYVFDYEQYTENRDFYLDLETMLPGYMSGDAGDIMKAIEAEKYDLDVIKEFSNKMIEVNSRTCTQRVCELVIDEVNNRRK